MDNTKTFSITIEDKLITTISELITVTKLDSKAITRGVEKYGSLQRYAEVVIENSVTIDGITLYSPANLASLLGVEGTSKVNRLWSSIRSLQTNEEKVQVIKKEIETRQKITDWFANGDSQFVMKDIIKTLGCTNVMKFKKCVELSVTKEACLKRLGLLDKSIGSK